MDLLFFKLYYIYIYILPIIGCVLCNDSFHNLTIGGILEGQYVLAKNAASGILLLLIKTSRHFSRSAHVKYAANAIFIFVYSNAFYANSSNYFFNPSIE